MRKDDIVANLLRILARQLGQFDRCNLLLRYVKLRVNISLFLFFSGSNIGLAATRLHMDFQTRIKSTIETYLLCFVTLTHGSYTCAVIRRQLWHNTKLYVEVLLPSCLVERILKFISMRWLLIFSLRTVYGYVFIIHIII